MTCSSSQLLSVFRAALSWRCNRLGSGTCTCISPQSVLVEYLMLRELTDRDSDAEKLLRFLEGIRATVNLIPWNPWRDVGDSEIGSRLIRSERPRRDRFASILRQAGRSVTIRSSFGADVNAACGCLANL